MGQKAKNAGLKKRSSKKAPIDRLSKQTNNLKINTANYEIVKMLSNIMGFKGYRRNSRDKQTLVLKEMTTIIDPNDTEMLSKMW